jgi:hypothetical protein
MKLVDKIVQREPQPNRKSFGTKGAQKNEMHPRLCTDVLVKIGQNGTNKLMRSRGARTRAAEPRPGIRFTF